MAKGKRKRSVLYLGGGFEGGRRRKRRRYSGGQPALVAVDGFDGARRRRRRRRGFALLGAPAGGGGGGRGMMASFIPVLFGLGGAIGGGILGNMIPIRDPRMKAAIPLLGGIALAAFVRQVQIRMIGTGMAIAGGMALTRQVAPAVPMLAGEAAPVTDESAAYAGELEEAGLDGLGLGAVAEVSGESNDATSELLGAVAEVSGEWRAPGA